MYDQQNGKTALMFTENFRHNKPIVAPSEIYTQWTDRILENPSKCSEFYMSHHSSIQADFNFNIIYRQLHILVYLFKLNVQYKIFCASGYYGDYCNISCNGNPMKCGNYCKEGSFNCTCPRNMTGKTCDFDVDECLSSPCKNNGTCTNTLGGFTCTCPSNTTGIYCDPVEFCSTKTCVHGQCVNVSKCICNSGYSGEHCDIDTDECLGYPCKNGGQCINNVGSYKCVCKNGFTGRICEIDIDECKLDVLNNNCGGHGTCKNIPGSFNCTCDSGYEGDRCQDEVNECLSNPCQNNGYCINIKGVSADGKVKHALSM
ncbi:hypothetical protein KUTeg_020883 [Tegillarca granosa]|uniref:EGF-like domain-containing protein n=1 Tax=Tegillarca granosa TaxID=220873 RepID=A0ABQ9E967_TEGGR|nr:hypothetical protein KUTeg_020883 [Tegillarca granosa]